MIPLRYATASQEITLGVFVDNGNLAPETALTIANTDILLWKTGATTLAAKNSGGATHISNGIYSAVLDATDTDTLGPMIIYVQISGVRPIKLECVVQPAVVYDSMVLGTDSLQVELTATGVDAIMDEVLTAATHDVENSLGRRVREVTSDIILTGTSPDTGGTANTAIRIELNGDASSADGTYDPSVISLVGGTGAGQSRQIFEYDGTNKYAYVNRSWKIIPDSTSEYVITADAGEAHVNEGYARGGTSETITLNPLADSNNDTYNGQLIFLFAGTGEDQARIISDYDGSTKIATVNRAWTTVPANGATIYAVLPTDALPSGIAKGVSLDSFSFLMVSSVDNVTPQTGLNITSTISKDGSGFSNTTNDASEISSGLYKIDLTSTEMTADVIVLIFSASGSNQRTVTLFPI